MFAVNVLKFGTSSPADVTPLKQLQKAGYRADQVLALAGKTEGDVPIGYPLHQKLRY
jgi:cyanuric acid amidohydrolase